jgi:hypothetical protein
MIRRVQRQQSRKGQIGFSKIQWYLQLALTFVRNVRQSVTLHAALTKGSKGKGGMFSHYDGLKVTLVEINLKHLKLQKTSLNVRGGQVGRSRPAPGPSSDESAVRGPKSRGPEVPRIT